MVMRITSLQVDPARVDEVLRLIETSVVPAAQQQPGFKQFTVAVDRDCDDQSHWALGHRRGRHRE